MGNIVGFHHAAIVVPDLDRAVQFYCALAGYEKIRESRWEQGLRFQPDYRHDRQQRQVLHARGALRFPGIVRI